MRKLACKGFRAQYFNGNGDFRNTKGRATAVAGQNDCYNDTKMNNYIAYCGLNCEKCEARLATINDDNELRKKVAREWSELNGIEITPAMISCVGCRIDGIKTLFCESLCPIRQCAMSEKLQTCGDCEKIAVCKKIDMIIGNNKDALDNLRRG